MKILITGTHFTPAQAVIKEVMANPDVEISYVGRHFTQEGDATLSAESKILPKIGVKFIPIISGRLQRAFSIYTITSLLKIPIGFVMAPFILLNEKPDIIVSFGGYVAVPVVVWGWLFSIPILIHEQTLVYGLANRISSIFADKIAVSFKSGLIKSPRFVLTGNPIRKELLTCPSTSIFEPLIKEAHRKHLPIIYITGGNQGSHSINQSVGGILNHLVKNAFVIHQTGDSKFKDFETLLEKKTQLSDPSRYSVHKWINSSDLSYLLHHTDLVISRAGINTLLELSFIGVPTIAIPFPFLNSNEQLANAKYFQQLGLVTVIKQSNLKENILLDTINSILKDLKKYRNRAQQAKQGIILDAAKRLVLEIFLLHQSHKQSGNI